MKQTSANKIISKILPKFQSLKSTVKQLSQSANIFIDRHSLIKRGLILGSIINILIFNQQFKRRLVYKQMQTLITARKNSFYQKAQQEKKLIIQMLNEMQEEEAIIRAKYQTKHQQ